MIHQIASTMVLGLPAVAWGGMLGLFFLLMTAAISILNKKGIHFIPFKFHPVFAIITIVIAILHGFFGLSMFLEY